MARKDNARGNTRRKSIRKDRWYFLILIFVMSALSLLWNNLESKHDDNSDDKMMNISISPYMCQIEDCEVRYIAELKRARASINCAFFEFELEKINAAIKESVAQEKIVLVDKDYPSFNESYIYYDSRSSYMHNKFCVIDGNTVITGSFNPTYNDKDRNDNNIIIIRSGRIAEIYEDYFRQLMDEHVFNNKSDFRREYFLNSTDYNITICFSRGGDCLQKIYGQVDKSRSSISMLLFSATDAGLASHLLLKHYSDVEVGGVFEKTTISDSSIFSILDYHNADVMKDCSKGKLHHKVFIIDNRTIITGSFNPSSNAEHSNDENMIIIENQMLAELYAREYERIRGMC